MKLPPFLVLGFLGTTALLLTGCAATGISSRIQEKSTAFNELNTATQEHIKGGNVERGYTKDMVYIALGSPNKVSSKKASDGAIEIWVYKNMILPNAGGFRGITYNSNMSIGPGFSPKNGMLDTNGGLTPDSRGLFYGPTRDASASGSQEQNAINMNAMASATELPDLPSGTLYVFFFQNRVYKLNMET